MTPEQNEVPPVLAEPSKNACTCKGTELPHDPGLRGCIYRQGGEFGDDPDATVVIGRHRDDGTFATRPAAPRPRRKRWIGRVAAAMIPRLRRRADQEGVA